MDYDCHCFFLNFIFYYYKVPIFILISAFNQIPAQLTFMLPYLLSFWYFLFFFFLVYSYPFILNFIISF